MLFLRKIGYVVLIKPGSVDGSKPCSSSPQAYGDLVPFSPRRVLLRFVNPRIGSKLLGFSI
jgi:hypothetical protein